MSRVTVFGFEVDIETVRYVAEELFGVSLPEHERSDEEIDDAGGGDGDRRGDAAASTGRSDALSRVEDDEDGTPVADDEDAIPNDGGSDSGGRTRRLLLAVGLIGTLGVLGLAVVWYLRRRGGEEDEHHDDDPGTADAAVDGSDAEAAGEESAGESESEEPPAPDFSPYIGMVFLAVFAAVVRWLRGASGDDGGTADGAESERRTDAQPPR